MPAKDIFYETFFKLELIKIVIQSQNLKFLIYNPEQEVIEQWIK